MSRVDIRSIVINLDSVPERLERMGRLADECGFRLERIVAIDGRDPGNAALIKRHRARGVGPDTISDTDVACMLSHRLAWESLVDSGERWLAVFEDDIHFGERMAELLVESWIPAGVSLIKLEVLNDSARLSLEPVASHAGRQLFALSGSHWGAAGYIVSRQAAMRLLELTEKLKAPVDYLMFDYRWDVMQEMVVHQIVPAVVIQDRILASRQGQETALPSWMDRSSLKRTHFVKRLLKRLVRPLKKLHRRVSARKLQSIEFGPAGPISFK